MIFDLCANHFLKQDERVRRMLQSCDHRVVSSAAMKLLVQEQMGERYETPASVCDCGWHWNPGYDYYLFLQDECMISAYDGARQFVTRLQDRSVGQAVEMFNAGLNRPRGVLQNKNIDSTMPGQFIDGKPADRVAVYLGPQDRKTVYNLTQINFRRLPSG